MSGNMIRGLRLAALLVLLAFIAGPVSAAVIKDIRMWHAPDHSRLVFDMDKRSKFKVFSLENPGRVVIDLENTMLRSKIPDPTRTGQFIGQIRLGSPDGSVTRLVFDLKKPVRYFIQLLKPSNNFQYRLVVDFYHHDFDPNKKTPVPAPLPVPGAPRDPSRDILVMIDPGHGGEDSGARGKRSYEKTVVLQISKRLKALIDAQPGMKAELTRTGDYYVKLRKRSTLARQNRADMFISIHADAFKDSRARGASVYALSLRGATSETAKILANKENLSDLAGGVSLADKDDLLAEVLLDLSMSSTVNESISFGREVLSELKKIGRVHSKRVEQAGFVVLKSPDVPSILVETAYITNPSEEKLLRSKQHQEKIAKAILTGVKRYITKSPAYYARQ
ncbi:MAG: N-acetylmuramoyl-L-alanine amidase [Arenicellales bacterium]